MIWLARIERESTGFLFWVWSHTLSEQKVHWEFYCKHCENPVSRWSAYVQVSWKKTNQEAIQVLFTLQAWHSVSSSTQFRVFFAYACLPLCRWLSIEKVHSDFIFKLSFFSFHTPECLLNSIQENFDALWDRVIDWPRYYTFLWYWEIHRPCVHGCICQMHSWRWL